ncbi:MAG: D-threitol dehydrogenase [Eubacteriales bacterium]|nr:D-threitol dehydrogenase [Eubacteriales bacterium]
MNYKPFDGTISIKDKVALITGAASGIGKATALAFAKGGARLVLIDMDPAVEDYAKELADEYGVETLPIVCDLTPVTAGPMIVEKADARFGRIDILASVAGIGLVDYAVNITEEIWDKTMLINSKAAFFLCQAVGKYMIKQGGGKIVAVASQGGVIATDRHVAYTASKAALIGTIKTLALEWGKYNINANLVSPTVVLTEMGERIWEGEMGVEMKKKIPSGRFCYPDEIAAAILFLASDAANMINGENLLVDGGYTVQ